MKQLKQAGFAEPDGKGSHTMWTCPHGRYRISVPTGHRTISTAAREYAAKLAKDLAAQGVAVRDIGHALGVSFRRAQQLISSS